MIHVNRFEKIIMNDFPIEIGFMGLIAQSSTWNFANKHPTHVKTRKRMKPVLDLCAAAL